MRIKRRGWFSVGIVLLMLALAAIPMIHPLEFRHGEIFVQGFFPAWSGPQGMHSSVVTDRGRVLLRFYDIHIGPFAWELVLNHNQT